MSRLLHQLFDTSDQAEQQSLPTIKHISHSNLGKELEDALNRTHHRYAIQKLAHIKQNPKKWAYSAKAKYDYLIKIGAGGCVARTSDGKYLQAKKSDVDFSGNVGSHHIAFDAKQTKGKSFPLRNVERHQVEQLLLTEQTGAVSGLMIWMSDVHKVFFVKASTVEKAIIEMLFKQARSSISLKQMEDDAVNIPINKDLREVDWLPVLKSLL